MKSIRGLYGASGVAAMNLVQFEMFQPPIGMPLHWSLQFDNDEYTKIMWYGTTIFIYYLKHETLSRYLMAFAILALSFDPKAESMV